MTRHWYVDDFTDEVIPCAPTLDAWAAWLASGEDGALEGERPADGAEFAVSTIDELCTIAARKTDGRWSLTTEPPVDATGFVCRAGREGWDAETWSETPLGHLDESGDWYPDGAEEDLVCVKDGPSYRCRFETRQGTHAPPRLVIIAEVQ